MLDISYIDAPIFVTPRGFEGHLFLGLGWAFRLVPPIERTIFGHDAPTGAWRHLDALLEKRGVHAPFSNERIFLFFADLVGNFKRDLSWAQMPGVRLIIQALGPFLYPAF